MMTLCEFCTKLGTDDCPGEESDYYCSNYSAILRDYNARKKVLKNIQNNVANLTEQFCSLRGVRIDAEIVKEKKMNEKKYILTEETKKIGDITLYRIQAVKDSANVKAGELGGWIEKEENLSQEGCCWIYGNAQVFGNAKVYGNAEISGNAKIFDYATISGNAEIWRNAKVFENADVFGQAKICGEAKIGGTARVFGNAVVEEDAQVYENSDIFWVSKIGSRLDTTTIFKNKDGKILIICGCFLGTLKEFEEQVEETRGNNKYGREYKVLIELIKIHFDLKEKKK